MKITTDHSASSYGQPVILDDEGNPMDFALGVRLIRRRLDLTTAELAALIVNPRTGEPISPRAIENWEQGRRMPDAAALHQLGVLISTTTRASE